MQEFHMAFSDPCVFLFTSHSLIHLTSFILGWMSPQSCTLSLSVFSFFYPWPAFDVCAVISAHMHAASHAHLHYLESDICQSHLTLQDRLQHLSGGQLSCEIYCRPAHKEIKVCASLCIKTLLIKCPFAHLNDFLHLCCNTLSQVLLVSLP